MAAATGSIAGLKVRGFRFLLCCYLWVIRIGSHELLSKTNGLHYLSLLHEKQVVPSFAYSSLLKKTFVPNPEALTDHRSHNQSILPISIVPSPIEIVLFPSLAIILLNKVAPYLNLNIFLFG